MNSVRADDDFGFDGGAVAERQPGRARVLFKTAAAMSGMNRAGGQGIRQHLDEIGAVLHGVLVGPIAPTAEQRRAITAPALILGHGIDLIHSFTDAARLARQIPDSRLIRTRTFAELWVRPARLTAEICEFLDGVWAGPPAQEQRGAAV